MESGVDKDGVTAFVSDRKRERARRYRGGKESIDREVERMR